MTVLVPALDKTGAYALQQQITTLGDLTDPGSAQLRNQREIDLVNSLLDQRKLDAASILSTLAPNSSHPITLQIAAITALAANYGATMPGNDAVASLDQLNRQLVLELMISAALTAAQILSTMTYVGSAAQ